MNTFTQKILIMKKVCTKCKLEKELSEFYKDKQKKSGHRPDCKICNTERCVAYAKNNRKKGNARNVKYKTGITPEMYNEFLKEQNNKCAICSKEFDGNKIAFSVDHCHYNGLIRGLLCNKCNLGLGYFDDNEIILTNAIFYLKNNMSYKNIKYKRWEKQ